MLTSKQTTRWLCGALALALVECAAVVALSVPLASSAQAQLFGGGDDRYSPRRYRGSGGGGGFFGDLFGGGSGGEKRGPDSGEQTPSDNSRAPSPRKPDAKAEPVTPTTSIVVMGDGMADWLAYGLEDAFADAPEVAILRKNKQHSGLLRYDPKSDLDWWHVARDLLAQEKASYVVMMLGVGDRQNIREKDLAKEAEKKSAEKKAADKTAADKTAADKPADAAGDKSAAPEKDAESEGETPSIISPEQTPGKRANGIVEFRTDKWAEIYGKRIDETIAAMKSKGVPVFWVGLPSMRGPKSTADAVYLNDLYRARAERAGAVYIDVWDGFVDETSKFSTFGPDYEGQMRRLRSNDGVYFTKYGARKLAHYVEREIRRYMSNRSLQVSLPTSPVAPAPGEAKSTARPLAGPVVPLTVTPPNSEELAGGSTAQGDVIATRVLTKGEPLPAPAGRADDFFWPRGGERPVVAVAPSVAAASASASVARPAAVPVTAPATAPMSETPVAAPMPIAAPSAAPMPIAAPSAAPMPIAAPSAAPMPMTDSGDPIYEPEKVEKKPEPKTPKTAQVGAQKPRPQGASSGNGPRPPAPLRPSSSNPLSGWFR